MTSCWSNKNEDILVAGAIIAIAGYGLYKLFGGGDSSSNSSSSSSSSYTPSYSEPTAEPTNTQASYANYQCSFKCYNFGGVTGWGQEGGPEHKFIISASSNSSANNKGLAHAKESCADMGYDGVLSQWGTGSISCKEQ